MQATIALVGLPGSGKSTVGRNLARRLLGRFVDTDTLIERRLQCTIRAYFEREGEDAFRDVEESVLAETVLERGAVIATGGGIVLRAPNRRALHDATTVVYLRANPDELYRRLRFDTQRPLLQVKDPQARFRELYSQRDPLYRETAHFVIETGRPSVSTLVNMVLMQLELAGVLASDAAPASVGAMPPEPPEPPTR